MASINDRFKEVRKMLGFNQKDFASELGISQTHVSNMEKGNDNPSTSLIRLVCYRFNINEEWLTKGMGEPEPTWDVGATESSIIKFNALRARLEKTLRKSNDADSIFIVETVDHLVSLLTIPMGLSGSELNDDDRKSYYMALRGIMHQIERLIYSVTLKKGLLPSSQDVQGWLDFKSDSDSTLNEMCKYAKEATNLYLSSYGENIKL